MPATLWRRAIHSEVGRGRGGVGRGRGGERKITNCVLGNVGGGGTCRPFVPSTSQNPFAVANVAKATVPSAYARSGCKSLSSFALRCGTVT